MPLWPAATGCIRPSVADPPPALTPGRWAKAHDPEGRIVGFTDIRRKIRRGGVDPSIRPEVWEFLLGCFAPDSTAAERQALRELRAELYTQLLQQWQHASSQLVAMSPLASGLHAELDQEHNTTVVVEHDSTFHNGTPHSSSEARHNNKFDNARRDEYVPSSPQPSPQARQVLSASTSATDTSTVRAGAQGAHVNGRTETPTTQLVDPRMPENWRDTQRLIELDVVRTDRNMTFYEGARNDNLLRMQRILSTYAWIDHPTGYCQGMSDLLSPFVILYSSDADAFWAFHHLMQRLRSNFLLAADSRGGPMGVHNELSLAMHIVAIRDPSLRRHLDEVDSGDALFAFRMVLVLFRRELSFDRAMLLWEMVWAKDYPTYAARAVQQARNDAAGAVTGWQEAHMQWRKDYIHRVLDNPQLCVDEPVKGVGLHLYIIAAVLHKNARQIKQLVSASDEMLKMSYDIFGTMRPLSACRRALRLRKRVPPEVLL